MKQNQKVYIKGNPNRSNDVIQTLKDLGGKNTNELYGNRSDAYYFIKPDGVIDVTSIIGGTACPFVKEFYKEIKLTKWRPKYEEFYYYIDITGFISMSKWYDSIDDTRCYGFGNCFKTQEEALATRNKIKNFLSNDR